MTSRSDRDDSYERGFLDAKEGRQRAEDSSDGFFESVVDGFLGGSVSEKKERYRDAYIKGYQDGLKDKDERVNG